ncbi:MAG: serine O-acetyltransferase EpsC [Acidobacteriota bacterium]
MDGRRPDTSVREFEITPIVEALCAASEGIASWNANHGGRQALPSREEVARILDDLRSVLFPGYSGVSDLNDETMHFHVGAVLDRAQRSLREQIQRAFCFHCTLDPAYCVGCHDHTLETTHRFLQRLPRVRHLLATDVIAAFEGDPAASCAEETVFCYPGVLAITNHRIAHELHQLEVPLLPRMISESAHARTGIDVHPGARIGEKFFIDHGTGVVIGETCEIGDRVRIYQGVTLGAKSFPRDAQGNLTKGIPRHPIIGDDVVIYAGATILGRVTIGSGSVIGGNVWLTHSVPPRSRISQARAWESK